MIGIIFVIEKFVQLIEKRNSLKSVFFETIHISVICFILMYVLGYFSISLDDTIGWGYGYYNFNLNSFINPLGVTTTNIDWSNFLAVKNFKMVKLRVFHI